MVQSTMFSHLFQQVSNFYGMTIPRTFLAEEGRKAVGELIANEKRHYLEPHHGAVFTDDIDLLVNKNCRLSNGQTAGGQ